MTEWEKYYLSLWNLNPIEPFIRTHSLVLNLDVWDLPFVQKYFSYEDSNDLITVSRFIEFVSIFVFFSLDHIIPSINKYISTMIVLLSMCSINGNVVILEVLDNINNLYSK